MRLRRRSAVAPLGLGIAWLSPFSWGSRPRLYAGAPSGLSHDFDGTLCRACGWRLRPPARILATMAWRWQESIANSRSMAAERRSCRVHSSDIAPRLLSLPWSFPPEGSKHPRGGRHRPREGSRRPHEGGDHPREGSLLPGEGSDGSREGRHRPREVRDSPREGSHLPRVGGRRPREGRCSPREGGFSPPGERCVPRGEESRRREGDGCPRGYSGCPPQGNRVRGGDDRCPTEGERE